MKYIVWTYEPYENWSYNEFDTLEQALNDALKNSGGRNFKITKEIKYKITEASIEAEE